MKPEGKFLVQEAFQKGNEPAGGVDQKGVIVEGEIPYFEVSIQSDDVFNETFDRLFDISRLQEMRSTVGASKGTPVAGADAEEVMGVVSLPERQVPQFC